MPHVRIVQGLNDVQRSQVEALASTCNTYENINLPLFIDESDEGQDSPYVRCYDDDTLMGFIYFVRSTYVYYRLPLT